MNRLLHLVSGLIILCLVSCNSPSDNSSDSGQKPDREEADRATEGRIAPQRKDSLDIVLEQEPNNTEALLMRGRSRLKRGDLQNALFDFQRIKAIDSNNTGMLLSLGELYMRRNQSRQAKNVWQNCANVDPQAVDCRINLGRLYTSIQDYKPALEYLNQAIDIDPYNAEAHLLKGLVIRDGVRDTSLALSFVQKATELDQNYIDALDLMGVMLSNQGDTLAPYYYQRILDIEPDRSDIYYKLGVHYMDLDEINKALESYTKAVSLNPYDADSYYNLGYIFTVSLKDFREARDYFTKSINARPEQNYKAYYGRGYAYEMLGDVINAKKDYVKAVELLPLYQPAMEGIARINAKSK